MSDAWVGQMRKGIAELCVLASLSETEAYGYEILSTVKQRPSLALKESTLYLLLGRLKKDGHVSFRSVPSQKGPPRRYFSLTTSGKERLANMAVFWKGFSADVDDMLKSSGVTV